MTRDEVREMCLCEAILPMGNPDSDRAGLGMGLGVGDGSSGEVLRNIGEIAGEYEVGGAKRVPVCNNRGAVGSGTIVDGPDILW
jgi:hypothetical protein